jgi:hypothetical protein
MFSAIRTVTVIALLLLLAVPALGQERTYPGAMCVEVGGKDQRQKPIRDEEGQLFNTSPSQTLAVVCPIVGLFNDNSGGEANVFLTDRNPAEDVCCEVRVNNVGAFTHSDTVCSEDTDNRFQIVTITPPQIGFSFTSRYFYCTIPPMVHKQASGILLYRY